MNYTKVPELAFKVAQHSLAVLVLHIDNSLRNLLTAKMPAKECDASCFKALFTAHSDTRSASFKHALRLLPIEVSVALSGFVKVASLCCT